MEERQDSKRQPTQKEKILTVTLAITGIALVAFLILGAIGVVKDSFGVEDMLICIGWAQIAAMYWNKRTKLDKIWFVVAVIYFVRGLCRCFNWF